MLTESAIVLRRVDHRVEVELLRDSACGGCELSQGCGTGAIGRLLGRRQRPLLVESDRQLSPGDRVVLSVPEAALVRVSLLIYGLPLLGMILIGLLMQALFSPAEWLLVLVCALGFWLGFRLATHWSAKIAQNLLLPAIVDIEVNPARAAGS